MPTARRLGGAVLILILASTAHAQAPTGTQTIAASEVEVRSGPSPTFYPTGKLRRGETVRVVREEEGWLAIVPPEGSFSWVRASLVDQKEQTATVKAFEVPLRVGSRIVDRQPDVERVKAKQGTQLVLIGKPVISSDGAWLPVLPHPTEVRYIPPDALRTSPPVQQQTVAAAAVNVPPAYTNPATPTPAGNPLLLEAQRAERDGNLPEAIRLYEQLARQVSVTDHELSLRCLNRSQQLRDYQAGKAPPYTATTYSLGADGRLAPAQTGQMASPYPPRQATSQYCYQVEPTGSTVRLAPPAVAAAATPPVGEQWYGPGRLYRTCLNVDSKTTYGFEAYDGRSHIYVTAAPGTTLEPFVNRSVYLRGQLSYRGELRTYTMDATQASAAR
jgi:uncharacterized protein YraI